MSDNITYKELKELIDRLPEERKEDNVTVFVPGVDEFYPISEFRVQVGDDVLDNGHPYLKI